MLLTDKFCHIFIWYLLVTQAFFNPELLNLIRTLVIGGDARELEQILAEGVGLVRTNENMFTDYELARVRDRCHVTLLDFNDSFLKPFNVSLLTVTSSDSCAELDVCQQCVLCRSQRCYYN
jgi:hypothetical protein